MTTRTKFGLWAALIGLAFLAGFIPQYLEVRRVRGELQSARDEIASRNSNRKLAHLRDLAGLLYLETNRKNYGLAGQYATQFYNAVSEAASQSSNASVKQELEQMLAGRDAITGGLAKGDPPVIGDVQALFEKTYELTKAEK